jgi:predicted transcriptional regulator
MNQMQIDVLSELRQYRKEKMGVGALADKLRKDENTIRRVLITLWENNLIECDTFSNGLIRRAKIIAQGEAQYTAATKIVSKASVKESINDLKDRLQNLENAFEELQRNPSEDNKKSFMDNVNTYQSVANGAVQLLKAGIDLFK